MGSSCSRVGRQGSSNNRRNNSSSSRSFSQVYENSGSSEVYYRENVVHVDIQDCSSNFDLGSTSTSSNAQTSVSYARSTHGLNNFSNENGERNAEAHNQVALRSEGQHLHAYHSDRAFSQAGSVDNASATVYSADQSRDEAVLSNTLRNVTSSHFAHDLESLSTDGHPGLNSENEDIVQNNSDVSSRSLGSGSPVTLYLLGFDSSRETPEEQDLGSGLHIDSVSLSSTSLSNIREVNTRELRSRGRRSFWDVFSRRNFRRHRDIPAILFAIEDADDRGVHGRLLLDTSSDRQHDIVAHDWGTRNRNRQRQSRVERSESASATGEEDRHRHLCASGLHQHGTCSCDLQVMGDELGALVRISRIVILVEAINELLDEIHRQTVPFSVSTLSLPAPESIVNSFPLKNHKRLDMTNSSEEAQQCYICLADYEEDDKIRVLPCKHEYHMACVDKWLKEVHGICPLCRSDVSVGSHPQYTQDTES